MALYTSPVCESINLPNTVWCTYFCLYIIYREHILGLVYSLEVLDVDWTMLPRMDKGFKVLCHLMRKFWEMCLCIQRVGTYILFLYSLVKVSSISELRSENKLWGNENKEITFFCCWCCCCFSLDIVDVEPNSYSWPKYL